MLIVLQVYSELDRGSSLETFYKPFLGESTVLKGQPALSFLSAVMGEKLCLK